MSALKICAPAFQRKATLHIRVYEFRTAASGNGEPLFCSRPVVGIQPFDSATGDRPGFSIIQNNAGSTLLLHGAESVESH